MEKKELKRFEELLEEGKKIMEEGGYKEDKWEKEPDKITYSRFLSQCLNLIEVTFGVDASYHKQLKQLATKERSAYNSYYFPHCYGILEAVYRDKDDIV